LVSVDAADPLSAAAFAHLAASLGETEDRGSVFRPEYAWLYCRAAQLHGFTSDQDLDLFARTFTTEREARAYYRQRQWDFDEVEYTYLERCAVRQPGAFPAALGEDYPGRGERLLLVRSERLEQKRDKEGAAACVEVLLQLAPRCARAH